MVRNNLCKAGAERFEVIFWKVFNKKGKKTNLKAIPSHLGAVLSVPRIPGPQLM
jgi:hypothetical protein